MKVERIGRATCQREAPAQQEAGSTKEPQPPQKDRDSFLLILQVLLAQLPDVCQERIVTMQLAVQSWESLPPAAETAAAMIAWYRCGEFSLAAEEKYTKRSKVFLFKT